ncbi:MAG: ArsR family transcriptional regulator [Thermoplasmata archaeon]|jgi:predicted transcriptional regulator|nr:ArsR family transcriptional regulator [Thermoplasmata archaeon]
MTDIDELLSIIENPTRRRILEYLTREPSYPLQLSKDLGISQQAVMKNLALMEQMGMLMSYPEVSNKGPSRTVYVPKSQFTLMIDLHDNMFTARLIPADDVDAEDANVSGMDEAMGRIGDIDSQIRELDLKRSALLKERNSIMSWLNHAIREVDDPEKRKELYGRLNTVSNEEA